MALNEKSKLLFGIVTYHERFWECISYQSLYQSYQQNNKGECLQVFIFDNTDEKDWILENPNLQTGVETHYQHDSLNPGISYAYNSIAQYAEIKAIPWIVFLDQDTELPLDFYCKYVEMVTARNDFKIAAPKIYANNGLLSPAKFIDYRSYSLPEIKEDSIGFSKVSCINSGLLISTKFYFQCGGYNRNLRLDFCDHDFIERVSKNTHQLGIIPVKLWQNFSAETNSKSQALSRYKLFFRDMKIYRLNKNKILFFLKVDMPHILKETIRHRSLSFLKVRLGFLK